MKLTGMFVHVFVLQHDISQESQHNTVYMCVYGVSSNTVKHHLH